MACCCWVEVGTVAIWLGPLPLARAPAAGYSLCDADNVGVCCVRGRLGANRCENPHTPHWGTRSKKRQTVASPTAASCSIHRCLSLKSRARSLRSLHCELCNMAQRWPAPKPRLAQEEFDDAVKTNIEDFDMGVSSEQLGVSALPARCTMPCRGPILNDSPCIAHAAGAQQRAQAWVSSKFQTMHAPWPWNHLLLLQSCCQAHAFDANLHAHPSPILLPQPEEAVKAAIEEFTVQGYDLSGVLKQAGGGNLEE